MRRRISLNKNYPFYRCTPPPAFSWRAPSAAQQRVVWNQGGCYGVANHLHKVFLFCGEISPVELNRRDLEAEADTILHGGPIARWLRGALHFHSNGHTGGVYEDRGAHDEVHAEQ